MHSFDKAWALQQDEKDQLSDFRQRFFVDNPRQIYLDGNSLGMLPKASISHMQEVVSTEWGRGLISSWNKGWYDRPRKLAAKIAPLIGAQPDEVIVADSTSVNIFKLAWAALKLQKGRKGIVTDELNFPSDIYLFQGLQEVLGNIHELRLAKSADGMGVETEELSRQMADDTALLSLSHVLFKSAFMYDMKAVTALAHARGAMVLWDLSHAAGAVPVDLNGCNADLAVGCTYKYLNGGPGSPAFLYVRKDLQQQLISPVQGWFGQQNPFDFKLDYEPAKGIERFLAGTPPMLSLSALEPSLNILLEAGIDNLRHKSLKQTRYLIDLFYHFLEPLGYKLGSPEKDEERGSHVSLRHPEAYRICKALIDPDVGGRPVIPDFREPDNIRLGVAPLYNSYEDIFDAVMQLKMIVSERVFEAFPFQRDAVT